MLLGFLAVPIGGSRMLAYGPPRGFWRHSLREGKSGVNGSRAAMPRCLGHFYSTLGAFLDQQTGPPIALELACLRGVIQAGGRDGADEPGSKCHAVCLPRGLCIPSSRSGEVAT